MTNKLFINRCETILVSMKAKDCQSVRTSEVAKWIEAADATAGQVMAKMCKFNIFKKVGAAQLTRYELSAQCHNSLIAAINEQNDIVKAVAKVVNWYVDHKSNPIPQQEVSESKKPIDAKRKQLIGAVLQIFDLNEKELEDLRQERDDLKAENELLRGEVERLQEIEKKYKQIIELVKIK